MALRQFQKSLAIGVLALIQPFHVLAFDRLDLRMTGAQEDALSQSLRAASTLESLAKDEQAKPRDVVAAARGDYARLVETLYAQGYYSAVVNIRIDGREAARIDPFDEPASIGAVQITVDPGPLYTFGRAGIAPLTGGNPPVEGFRPGAPALATVVRDAAQTALRKWHEKGYPKAEIVDQSIVARHSQAQLDVDLRIAKGLAARFGDTSVTGKSTVREPRVRQIAGLPRGEKFATSQVEKAASRLRKTGTFQSVQIAQAEEVNRDGTLDMEIAVVDRKPRRIGGGLEFSSFNGFQASAFWLHRNIFGGAERLRFDGKISQIGLMEDGIDYTLSFRLDKPAVYGPDTGFYIEGGFAYLDEPDFLERKIGLSVGVSREFDDHLTAELGLGFSYSEVTDRFEDPEKFRALQLITLPAAVTYDRRDDPVDATSGYYLRAGATPFYETINNNGGAHLTFDARAYRAFGADERLVMANRLQLGGLVGPGGAEAPPGMLFYSGGGGTVRGQPYKSLDATYDDGTSLGGRAFAAFSTEARLGLTDTIGMVAFADAGYIGADDFEDGDTHAGAGLGLRYKTPVGPIRVDIAAPVSGDTGGGVQFYVGIGQAF